MSEEPGPVTRGLISGAEGGAGRASDEFNWAGSGYHGGQLIHGEGSMNPQNVGVPAPKLITPTDRDAFDPDSGAQEADWSPRSVAAGRVVGAWKGETGGNTPDGVQSESGLIMVGKQWVDVSDPREDGATMDTAEQELAAIKQRLMTTTVETQGLAGFERDFLLRLRDEYDGMPPEVAIHIAELAASVASDCGYGE